MGSRAGLDAGAFHSLLNAGGISALRLPWISIIRSHGAGGALCVLAQWLLRRWCLAYIMAAHDTDPEQTTFSVHGTPGGKHWTNPP